MKLKLENHTYNPWDFIKFFRIIEHAPIQRLLKKASEAKKTENKGIYFQNLFINHNEHQYNLEEGVPNLIRIINA